MIEQDASDGTGSFPDSRSRGLYELALRGQWRAEEAIDWSRLSFELLSPPLRGAMARLYADVSYAETFGVDATARMVELAPEGWLREFAEAADA